MYWIKTYGAKHCDFRFHRYPSVIERARKAIADPDVAGYLLCALERTPKITGLLFFDSAKKFPEGLPFHALPVINRCRRAGYDLFTIIDGGTFVVAHWLHENGALDHFDRVH